MSLIEVYKGRETVLVHTYKDASGVAQSIAGLIITGAVKRTREGTVVQALTSAGATPQIEIVEDGGSDTGVFNVSFTAAMTANWTAGAYEVGYSYQTGEAEPKHFFGEYKLSILTPVDA